MKKNRSQSVRCILIALALLLSSVVCAEQSLTFQHLEGLPNDSSQDAAVVHLKRSLASFHQKTVLMRGFAYKTPEGQVILSSEPNLKSCCVASHDKIAQQVFLQGDFSLPEFHRAVAVRGTFIVEPKWDSSGTLTQLYRLENASLASDATPWPLNSILLAVIGIVSTGIAWRLFRQGQKIDEQ